MLQSHKCQLQSYCMSAAREQSLNHSHLMARAFCVIYCFVRQSEITNTEITPDRPEWQLRLAY